MECLSLRYPFCLGCHSAWAAGVQSMCRSLFKGCWCKGMRVHACLLTLNDLRCNKHMNINIDNIVEICVCVAFTCKQYMYKGPSNSEKQIWLQLCAHHVGTHVHSLHPPFASLPAVSLVVRVQTSSRMCKWWWISWERTQCLGWMLIPWRIKHKLVDATNMDDPRWMINISWFGEVTCFYFGAPHEFIRRTGEGLIPIVS